MKIIKDETIYKFNALFRDISNNSFALSGKMSDEKTMKKILRSLSKIFDMKVTIIEEAQDVSTMKVDELINSLLTFEMTIDDKFDKKD